MKTIFIEKEQINDNKIVIEDKAEINHLKNVLRLKIGDELRAVDGEMEYFCIINEIEKKTLIIEIKESKLGEEEISVKIDLGIGILKNDKMDLVIQKATELGINKIIPFTSIRSVVKLNEKKEKWEKIAREAMKQCRGIKLTKIEEPFNLKEINYDEYDCIIVPYEAAKDQKIKEFVNHDTHKILYLIGPEGGFELEEIEFLKGKKANIVSLGKRILRAETAAIVAGGILVNEFN